MASYRVEWKRSATKELRALPQSAMMSVLRAVEALAENPFPHGSRKLIGTESTYRIREGSYRVIYTVMAKALLIEIVRVGHRKDIYRD
jgi:mRNA interferase RelE/StbE